jgi:hypothetical protein
MVNITTRFLNVKRPSSSSFSLEDNALLGLPLCVQRGPSEAARCASTGDKQANFPLSPFLDKKKKRRL